MVTAYIYKLVIQLLPAVSHLPVFLTLRLAKGVISINLNFSLDCDLNQLRFFCWKETKFLYITESNLVDCDERSNNIRRQKASHIEF